MSTSMYIRVQYSYRKFLERLFYLTSIKFLLTFRAGHGNDSWGMVEVCTSEKLPKKLKNYSCENNDKSYVVRRHDSKNYVDERYKCNLSKWKKKNTTIERIGTQMIDYNVGKIYRKGSATTCECYTARRAPLASLNLLALSFGVLLLSDARTRALLALYVAEAGHHRIAWIPVVMCVPILVQHRRWAKGFLTSFGTIGSYCTRFDKDDNCFHV